MRCNGSPRNGQGLAVGRRDATSERSEGVMSGNGRSGQKMLQGVAASVKPRKVAEERMGPTPEQRRHGTYRLGDVVDKAPTASTSRSARRIAASRYSRRWPRIIGRASTTRRCGRCDTTGLASRRPRLR